MLLSIMSDVHIEFEAFAPPGCDADLVILAGDIGLGCRGLEWAAGAFAGTPVVYVPGNHEYYRHAVPKLTGRLKQRGAEMGIHVLEGDSVEIGGARIYGATLWTDFLLLGDRLSGELAARQLMTDYRLIRVSPQYRRLHPRDTASMHARTCSWLEREIAAGNTRGSIIVTHHAPSARSLRPGHAGDEVNAAFASHLDDVVARSGAALWIHGHTHYSTDYTIGGTRVLSNQRGYPGEDGTGFTNDLRVAL